MALVLASVGLLAHLLVEDNLEVGEALRRYIVGRGDDAPSVEDDVDEVLLLGVRQRGADIGIVF